MFQAQEYFFSKNKDEFIKTTQVDTKTIFTAGVCKSLVVDGDFFKKEKLIDLMYFKNLYGKKILLIVTDSSVYTLLIAEENQNENNFKSPNYSIFEQKLKPTKLFDLNVAPKELYNAKDFNIIEAQIKNGILFLNLESKNVIVSPNEIQSRSLYIFLKLIFEKREKKSNFSQSLIVESYLNSKENIEIQEMKYFLIHKHEVKNFYPSNNFSDEVFYSIRDKLYCGSFSSGSILTGSNAKLNPQINLKTSNFVSDFSKLVFRNKCDILKMEFSESMDRVLFPDKSNRLVLLDVATFEKKLIFQCKQGKIMNFVWHTKEDSLFV